MPAVRVFPPEGSLLNGFYQLPDGGIRFKARQKQTDTVYYSDNRAYKYGPDAYYWAPTTELLTATPEQLPDSSTHQNIWFYNLRVYVPTIDTLIYPDFGFDVDINFDWLHDPTNKTISLGGQTIAPAFSRKIQFTHTTSNITVQYPTAQNEPPIITHIITDQEAYIHFKNDTLLGLVVLRRTQVDRVTTNKDRFGSAKELRVGQRKSDNAWESWIFNGPLAQRNQSTDVTLYCGE